MKLTRGQAYLLESYYKVYRALNQLQEDKDDLPGAFHALCEAGLLEEASPWLQRHTPVYHISAKGLAALETIEEEL